jgi:sulfite reductase alpha subunit-like flavoprotein
LQAGELPNTQLVIFVTSCFGRGEPTDNARDFFNWLTVCFNRFSDKHSKPYTNVITLSFDQKSDKSSVDLSKLNFTVFGLGSSAYSPDRYQGAFSLPVHHR